MATKSQEQQSKPDGNSIAHTQAGELYAKLAEISHAIFTNRQGNEWRMSFSFWIGLGLVDWFLLTSDGDNLPRLSNPISIWLIFTVLFCLYIFFQIFVSRLNKETSNWRYFYMDKAEGRKGETPTKPPWYAFCRNHWFYVFVPFTAVVLGISLWIALNKLLDC